MNIKKMYTVVEITCEHSLLNTTNDGIIEIIGSFDLAHLDFLTMKALKEGER